MWNFQDTFETCKQSFISAFSICMTVSLKLTPQNGQTHSNNLFARVRLTILWGWCLKGSITCADKTSI